MKETFLITGANRGIGLQLTKFCLSKKFNVEAWCRNPETSDELNNLSNPVPITNIFEGNFWFVSLIINLTEFRTLSK